MKISSKNHFKGISTFMEINEVLHPKKKTNIAVFLIFLCKLFLEKNFQKIKYQLEISSKNDNSRY